MASLGVAWGICRGNRFLSMDDQQQQQSPLDRTRLYFLHGQESKNQQKNHITQACSLTANPVLPMGDEPRWFERIRETTNKTRTKERVQDHIEEAICPENLDEWMKNSVAEIVKNIGEAPFLVHVYSDEDRMGSSPMTQTRLEREKIVAESWRLISKRWFEGSSRTPQGVILVEELKNKDHDDDHQEGESNDLPSTTRAWGILVQARGVDCPACYILKTCRVRTTLGFCTHFCLVRAKCFAETAELQLKNLWLQR